mmetsp:Transcript_87085/g.241493  ORF Transcript_87085/g.241493 Transcript_87085/m.241493 type:complete len:280 (+) Transcript_87085:910-1749(+)
MLQRQRIINVIPLNDLVPFSAPVDELHHICRPTGKDILIPTELTPSEASCAARIVLAEKRCRLSQLTQPMFRGFTIAAHYGIIFIRQFFGCWNCRPCVFKRRDNCSRIVRIGISRVQPGAPVKCAELLFADCLSLELVGDAHRMLLEVRRSTSTLDLCPTQPIPARLRRHRHSRACNRPTRRRQRGGALGAEGGQQRLQDCAPGRGREAGSVEERHDGLLQRLSERAACNALGRVAGHAGQLVERVLGQRARGGSRRRAPQLPCQVQRPSVACNWLYDW